jgi:hypothetical protein
MFVLCAARERSIRAHVEQTILCTPSERLFGQRPRIVVAHSRRSQTHGYTSVDLLFDAVGNDQTVFGQLRPRAGRRSIFGLSIIILQTAY